MPLTAAPPERTADLTRARRLLWMTVTVTVLDVAIGGGWDAEWHRTRPFDGFFSPPHLFIYAMASIAMALVAWLVVTPELRQWFGPPQRLPLTRFAVPGPLLLLSGGMAGLALAGPLDAIWHTRFGLDETPWSVPHAMLGTSMLLIALGVIACRLALAQHSPMRPWTLPLLCLLGLYGTLTFLGPFGNLSPNAVRIASEQGALATDPDAQRTFRIYLRWNLSRTNPAFAAIGAAWAAYAIALARALIPRALVWFPLVLLFAILLEGGAAGEAERLGLADDVATRTGVPVLWAAIPVLLLAKRRPVLAWAGSGLVFGLVSYAVWSVTEHPVAGLAMAALAPLAALLGAAAGNRTADIVQRPAGGRVLALAAIVILGWPSATGVVDLLLRTATP